MFRFICGAVLLFSVTAQAGEMFISENYSIKVDLSNSSPVTSDEPIPPSFIYVDPNRWSTADTVREAVYLTLHTIDWLQTLSSTESKYADGKNRYSEQNPVLGNYPKREKVNIYFALTGLAHYGVAYILPAEWRQNFQYFTAGMEVGIIGRNYLLVGIRIPV